MQLISFDKHKVSLKLISPPGRVGDKKGRLGVGLSLLSPSHGTGCMRLWSWIGTEVKIHSCVTLDRFYQVT